MNRNHAYKTEPYAAPLSTEHTSAPEVLPAADATTHPAPNPGNVANANVIGFASETCPNSTANSNPLVADVSVTHPTASRSNRLRVAGDVVDTIKVTQPGAK